MPVMDGLSCAKLIRAMPRYRRVPIIIVSAHLDMVKAGDLITDTIPKVFTLSFSYSVPLSHALSFHSVELFPSLRLLHSLSDFLVGSWVLV